MLERVYSACKCGIYDDEINLLYILDWPTTLAVKHGIKKFVDTIGDI